PADCGNALGCSGGPSSSDFFRMTLLQWTTLSYSLVALAKTSLPSTTSTLLRACKRLGSPSRRSTVVLGANEPGCHDQPGRMAIWSSDDGTRACYQHITCTSEKPCNASFVFGLTKVA